MDELYSNLNWPGSYSAESNLRRETKGIVSKKDFEKFTLTNRTHTQFKPARKRFLRLKTIPLGYLSGNFRNFETKTN